MTLIQAVFGIFFFAASTGWALGVYQNYLESKKKSRYNDPHDQIYH